MEFPFSLEKILPDEVTIVNGDYLQSLKEKESITNLQLLIDRVGQSSARAQGLHVPVTSFSKLRIGDDRTYLLREMDRDSKCLIGLLKVGYRKLFLHDVRGIQHEMCPLAVLDFYIHESKQRNGNGRKLFDYMIQNENVLPQHLAIDRPSPKMLGFLSKHYRLKHSFLQPNSYAVFEGFFSDRSDYKLNSARSLPFKPHQRAGSIMSNTPNRVNSAKSTSGQAANQQRLASTELHHGASSKQHTAESADDQRGPSFDDLLNASRRSDDPFARPPQYPSPPQRAADLSNSPSRQVAQLLGPPSSNFRTPDHHAQVQSAFQLRKERSSDQLNVSRNPFSANYSQPPQSMQSVGKTRSVSDLRSTDVPRTLKNDHVTQQQIDNLLDRLHEAHLSRNRFPERSTPVASGSNTAMLPPHPPSQGRPNGFQNSRMPPARNQQNKNTTFWSIFGVN